MKKYLTYVVAAAAFGIPGIAFADCSGLAMASVQGSYPLQDLGVDASGGKPVSQDMIAVTCGKFSVDVWTSAQLSGGTYGHRGSGDEWDGEFSYSDSFKAPMIGKVGYTLYGAYFALDLGRGLGSPRDDKMKLFAEVTKSIPMGKWALAPYVRLTRLQSVSRGYNNFDLIRPGVRVSGPIGIGGLSASGEFAASFNTSSGAPHRSTLLGVVSLSKPLGHGVAISGGAKFTQHVSGVTPFLKLTKGF